MFGICRTSGRSIIVGVVMLAYVLFGGMIATTWVQIIKAVLLLFGVTLLAVLVLSRFHFSPGELYAAVAARYGQAALEPGGLVSDPIDAVSLGLALMLGLLGLPHILMRFYTVPDARAARASVLYATGFIGYFYLIIPIVGFGASALVGREMIRTGRCRRQHGGAAGRGAARRHAVPRVHRRGGVRDDPRRRRRPDAGRRERAVARHLHARHARRTRHRARADSRRADRDRGLRRSSPSCSASCSRGRTSRSWSAWRSRSPASANFPPLLLSIVWRASTPPARCARS